MLLYAQHKPINLLIGTYTNTGKSEGIYVYTFDLQTGDLTYKNKVVSENPSFLTFSPNKRFVYAVNELNKGKGATSAFSYDHDSGALTLLNQQLTEGDDPCNIVTDQTGKHVLVSNYSGGSLTVFGTKEDGSLTERQQLIVHQGSGPDKNRQEKAHVHSATFSPDHQFLLVQDLGTDRIAVYGYNELDNHKPVQLPVHSLVPASAGSGPRLVTFSKDKKYVYLIQEMKSAVTVYRYQQGQLTRVQEISMLSPTFKGAVGAADIHISPDGKFLYASNRGEANDIAIYSINPADGKLTYLKNQSVGGKGPRSFTIAPGGKYVLIANQYTNDVIVFERDSATGFLKNTGKKISVGAPVCLVFE
ncbi:lactonase family protein [Olivibacter ginsenosidimutans]|uniref:Lactonase family protein n=2 Tax=Olivibacter ginsenosidimutans TaxID=1176537 RepID=A0ABP9ARR1_9SPHI